jgi:hypothetical protein
VPPSQAGQWESLGGPTPPDRPTLLERLGGRAWRRPEPRLTVVLAGVGAALVLAGAAIWAFPYYVAGLDFGFDEDGFGGHGSNSRRFLGVVLFLGITIAGYLAAFVSRRGAVASAGAVAAAFGVPLTLAFLTLDGLGGGLFLGGAVNLDVVFVISILVWLIDYTLVPGLRGRALFLTAAAVALYSYVGTKVADGNVLSGGVSVFGLVGGGRPDASATTGIGLIFGLAYYAIAAALDRQRRHGIAVAFVIAGFIATASGLIAGAEDMGRAGTGVLLMLLGLVLCAYGASAGRRFTAWAWGAAFALGAGLVVQRVFSNSYTGTGITLAVVGIAVVAGAHLLGRDGDDGAEPEPAGD